MSIPPNALTIAGSDSGGGAGIQADLKAFSALGAYGASVITALTAQNTCGVDGVYPVTPDFVVRQLSCVFRDIQINAVKTGMLGDAEMVAAVADFLAEHKRPLVVDPVMIAKSGDALLQPDAIQTLVDKLIPLATIITPNLPEAAAILGEVEPETVDDMTACAKRLAQLGCHSVLLKGGHLQGGVCTDVLYLKGEMHLLESPRFNTQNTHGTGCTLASAITALLARGLTVDSAVKQAKKYITAAIESADALNVGKGHGPVHHFHGLW